MTVVFIYIKQTVILGSYLICSATLSSTLQYHLITFSSVHNYNEYNCHIVNNNRYKHVVVTNIISDAEACKTTG